MNPAEYDAAMLSSPLRVNSQRSAAAAHFVLLCTMSFNVIGSVHSYTTRPLK